MNARPGAACAGPGLFIFNHMKIKFFAYIRDKEYAGCKETELNGVKDLRELGEALSLRYGGLFRKLYFSPDGNNFGEEIIVLVNGRRAEFMDGMNTMLQENDTVLLFPVVAGG